MNDTRTQLLKCKCGYQAERKHWTFTASAAPSSAKECPECGRKASLARTADKNTTRS
jgi:hypothetical protein